MNVVTVFVRKELWVYVPVAIFFPTEDSCWTTDRLSAAYFDLSQFRKQFILACFLFLTAGKRPKFTKLSSAAHTLHTRQID